MPRQSSQAPISAAAIMKKPMTSMMRKAKNTVFTGGRFCGATSFSPMMRPLSRCVRISEPAFGIDSAQWLVSAFSSGQAKMWKSTGSCAVPVRLHGGDLDRLMLERVEPVQVADQQLQRREHRQQHHRHLHHGAGLLGMAVGERVARADRQHHEAGGEDRRR